MTALFILYILLFVMLKVMSFLFADFPYLSIFMQQLTGIFLPLFIYTVFIKKESYLSKSDFKIKAIHIPLIFIAGFCMQLFFSFINMPVIIYLENLGIPAPSMPPVPNNGRIFLHIFTVCCLPAFAEEIFFRKYTYDVLNKIGNINALIGTALIFAISHLNLYSILPLILTGLTLSYLRYKGASLIYAVTLHFSLNFSGILLDFLTRNEFISSILYNHFAIINILSGALTIGFFVFINSFFKEDRQ